MNSGSRSLAVTFATVTEVNPRRGLVTQTEGLDEEQLTKVFQRARGGSSRRSSRSRAPKDEGKSFRESDSQEGPRCA